MDIIVHTFTYNEEFLLPYFLKHYRFADRIIVHDNCSTDDTCKIALSNPNTEVIPWDTGNKIITTELTKLKSNCWKQDKSKWVIVCDVDEFMMGHEQLFNYKTPVAFKCEGFSLVSSNKENLEKISLGRKCWWYDKVLCFDPSIKDINYDHGCHFAKPTCPIIEDVMKLYHYEFLGPEYQVKRRKRNLKRLSDEDIKEGHCIHYSRTEETIREEYRIALAGAVKIPLNHHLL